jgi:hypothetical protein
VAGCFLYKAKDLSAPPRIQSGYRIFGPLMYGGEITEMQMRFSTIFNFHLVPRSRKVELYLHSPICLHGIVLT